MLLYHIFSYLLIFRYDDLPKDEIRSFLLSQDYIKMHVFLSFLFDPKQLREVIFEDWCAVYDEEYIEDTIMEGLEKKKVDLQKVLDKIEERAVGNSNSMVNTASRFSQKSKRKSKAGDKNHRMMSADGSRKKKTVFKPFNLSKGKPRVIPKPIKI